MKVHDEFEIGKQSYMGRRGKLRNIDYTDDELLELLKRFHDESGRIPSQKDFMSNLRYPDFKTYINHFGSWTNALKMVKFDADTLVNEGVLGCSYHKGRLAELLVFNSFKDRNSAVDLSGLNCNSIFDGLCPRGKSYDVKSSSLRHDKRSPSHRGFFFHLRNKEMEKIEYIYFVAVDENYERLCYVWLIPVSDLEKGKDFLYVSVSKIHDYDKYIVDFTKCNLESLKRFKEKDNMKGE